jgi:hypothetical protein
MMTDTADISTMTTPHRLEGIDLRYVLTQYLLQHGPTTVDELIAAIRWQGLTSADEHRSGFPTHCAGREDAAEFVGSPAVCTPPDRYHVQRSIGSISAS